MVRLSIVTLNFKTPEVTLSCIDSVQNILKKEFERGIIEHIIVDNHSQDNSSSLIKKHLAEKKYRNVKYFESSENNGFGAGNNFGVKHTHGQYILFLNSDTNVKDRGIFDMVEFLEQNKDAGIVGGQLTNPDGSPQVSGWKFYSLINLIFLLLGFERFGFISSIGKTIRKVDWVTGGCFMIKRSAFEKVGGFDENIFMYTEDMELCFRVKKIGLSTYYYPNVSIIHLSQRSSNRGFAIFYIYKGILFFYKKHKPLWQYYMVKLLLKSKAFILVIIGKVLNNSYLSDTYEKALSIS